MTAAEAQQQHRWRNAEQRRCRKVTSEEAENTHNDINQWWATWDSGFKGPSRLAKSSGRYEHQTT